MAVNKNRIVAQAQRYTAKGQFEKAIAEYRRLLRIDPGDIRTWLKIGDLYTRMGARKEATETYIRVAEQYTKSGFHLKAIAVYKQVLNLDPTLVIIHKYLAASYLELGLTSEALIQLEQLADAYQRTNRPELLLEVLLQMGSIDSRNIATRLRIAELLSKENRVAEATKHFSMACDELRSNGRRDDFVKVAERLFYHDPSRLDIAREIAEMYIQRGRFKDSLSKLQACFAKDPKNPNTLELLASTFRGLGQPDKAISVYEEIFDLVKELGDERKQRAILEEILTLDPENEKAKARLARTSISGSGLQTFDEEIISDVIMEEIEMEDMDSLSPAPIDLSEEISVSAEPDLDIEDTCQELLGEVQVLIKYGLKDRALSHLEKVFEIDEFHIDGRELAKDILLDLNRPNDAIEQLFLMADAFKETQPEGSIYYLHEILKIDASNGRAREMIEALGGIMPDGIDDDTDDFDALDEDSEELLLLEDDEDIVLVNDDDLMRAGAVASDDSKAKNENDWSDLDIEGASLDEDSDVLTSTSAEFAAANQETSVSMELEIIGDMVEEVASSGKSISVEFDAGLGDDESASKKSDDDTHVEALPMALRASEEPTPMEEERAEEPTPIDEEIKEAKTSEPSTEEETSQTAPEEEPDSDSKEEETSPPPEIDDDIEEIQFFIEQELLDEAKASLDDIAREYPNDPRVKALLEQLSHGRSASESEEPPPPVEAKPEEPEIKSTSEKAKRREEEEPSVVVDVIEDNSEGDGVKFKNVGLQEKVSNSDSATNWDLGLAYKEMGLLEDAIQAFDIASRDPLRTALAKMMIGMCFVALDRKDQAVKTFEEGLAVEPLDEQQKMGLLYELGKTLQMMGERDRALTCFRDITTLDDSFADVAARIEALNRFKANPVSV